MPAWQERPEISPEGRLAAWTIAGLLVLSGAGFVLGAWRDTWMRCPRGAPGCAHRAALAGLVSLIAVLVVGLGVAIGREALRRPVRADARSRYPWGLGAMFALGAILASRQIPAWTCDVGRFDEVLRTCVTVFRRTPPRSAVALRDGLVGLGVLGGVAVAALPRWIRLSAPATAAVWLTGAGWMLLGTFVRP